MSARLLELKDVQKDYRTYRFGWEVGRVKALNKLSFHVDKGEIFGFLGPNGAGKTTTIKCIVGILSCDGGSIRIDGVNIEDNRLESKNMIGFLPEQIGLYGGLTPVDTLRYYGGFYELEEEIIEERGRNLLKKLGLAKDTERPVRGFSLGMRKRLALAVALLHNPEILVLDEPTSGLDPRGVKALRNVLRELNEGGLTIILSSHALPEIQEICTHVGIIDKGRMIRQETIEGIRKEVKKTAITLSLRVKDFKEEDEKRIDRKKGVSVIGQTAVGRHTQVLLKLKENMIPWVTDTLVSNGVKIFSIEPRKNSLEDVFLKETGSDTDD
ncbi:MAG: ABC transporter ATP-binding protein [Candidatus Thermoplasmatota archaeon]|nr:ABC transporter ATP-binding protein [Candidatus Thermoplasmatota archaeon]MEC9332579.1 ABC transporter ATP-binding protein [Candidatus Thermoplasmatota archaeon]